MHGPWPITQLSRHWFSNATDATDATDTLSERMQAHAPGRHTWTAEEDAALIGLVARHDKHWKVIAQELPGKNAASCCGHWRGALDPRISKVRLHSLCNTAHSCERVMESHSVEHRNSAVRERSSTTQHIVCNAAPPVLSCRYLTCHCVMCRLVGRSLSMLPSVYAPVSMGLHHSLFLRGGSWLRYGMAVWHCL